MVGNNTSGLDHPVASQAANRALRAVAQLSLSLGAISITIMALLGGLLPVSL